MSGGCWVFIRPVEVHREMHVIAYNIWLQTRCLAVMLPHQFDLLRASLIVSGRAMLSAPVQSAVKRDLWAMAEGEDNDKPLMIRFRSELRKVDDVSGYPELLLVEWKYESDSHGMPTDAAVEATDDFEDLLLAALEHDFQTVLVCVITNNGKRQWVCYSSDIHVAETRINAMPQKAMAYPIELLTDDDAEWSYFKDNILGECDEAEEPV